MEIIRHGEDKAYEAAWSGCVESLNALIEKDPHILRNLAPVLTSKTLTPLHISASLGHLEITKTYLTYIPELAEALNSVRSTPLHLASSEGHKEIVQALLLVYPGACLCFDEKGRIPLHYAAMRGDVEVLKKLTHANHDSIYVRVDNRSTVLHLCVKYNQLECLKFLVQLVRDNGEFLNSKDGSDAGMTILQLAWMRGQVQIMFMSSVALQINSVRINLHFVCVDYDKRTLLRYWCMLTQVSTDQAENAPESLNHEAFLESEDWRP
ncbi:PREDICTED: ankyrin repeat and sterile alpha motif domain-containing protein 1B-like [Prunus mume]|uniref:Ankyrin repeat and sterile alpha motif domain-containing protein 1B-like n=1 Tax=Prunus mume TaxID=102107 RepID=A0ABM0NZP4_PRUMU|nr:PREDICTED: ankyrin repeat and sterile alpha motif domain-containing protein 1B-like [Prunus mume]